MATLTMRTETTGARPQFGTVEIRRRDGVRNAPEEFGRVRARQLNERANRAWELVWDEATPGERIRIERLFDDSLGGVFAMNFTPLGDVDANSIEIIFVEDTLRMDPAGTRHWRIRALVEEAF